MVQVPANHGRPFTVIVFRNGQGQASHGATAGRIEAVRSLHRVPAVVEALLHQIDLFEPVLSNVGNEKTAGPAFKREAPRIAKAISPDLAPVAGADEGIVRRNRVLQPAGERRIYANPQDFSQQGLAVLAITLRVAFTAAVAERDVKKPVRPEGHLSALVIREGL